MKKNIFLILFLCIFVSFPIFSQENIASHSYCVLNITKQEIVSHKNSLQQLPPASTVKLLTAMVVLDNKFWNQEFVTSPKAVAVEPTKLGLENGDKMIVKDLLHALLLKSANDVAIILAEGVAGSVETFAQLMNEKAKQLGCQQSNFVTPNGLPAKNQYSCAYDLAVIAANASCYSQIREILNCPSTYITSSSGKKYYIKTGNKLSIGKYPVYGKTGWTTRAGNTFCGFTTINNEHFAIAVLKVPRRKQMWEDILHLLGLKDKVHILEKTKANIQRLLHKKGYYKGKLDGRLGPKSIEAIKKFQKDNNLEVDGKVGPNTWDALNQ
ncbi:MAG TPA: peptidoglycan-binding protein [Planctomycetota bacterium]|nr:peptidoglycan-binding protein [Planctomycetota bacterium]